MEMHFATSAFVVNQDGTKVLMVYHKKLNTWVIPGGHLERNEYPAMGAAREVLEETGIHASIYNCGCMPKNLNRVKEDTIATPFMMLSEAIPAHGDKQPHIHMDFIFLAKANDEAKLQRQEEEVNDVRWIPIEEVIYCETFESVKEIAREILKRGGIEKCVNLGS